MTSVREFIQQWMAAVGSPLEPPTGEDVLANTPDLPEFKALREAVVRLPPGTKVWPTGPRDFDPSCDGVLQFPVTVSFRVESLRRVNNLTKEIK